MHTHGSFLETNWLCPHAQAFLAALHVTRWPRHSSAWGCLTFKEDKVPVAVLVHGVHTGRQAPPEVRDLHGVPLHHPVVPHPPEPLVLQSKQKSLSMAAPPARGPASRHPHTRSQQQPPHSPQRPEGWQWPSPLRPWVQGNVKTPSLYTRGFWVEKGRQRTSPCQTLGRSAFQDVRAAARAQLSS